jgi:LuxR family maltose regulon positive regulatory protein
VLTRYEPAFRLEKLHLAGDVVRLPRELLVFDAGQVADVIEHRSGRRHDPAQVQRLLDLTEGWPASVVLAGMALAWLDVGSLHEALADPRLRGDVFSYLAEQVFQRQSEDVQHFLIGTCCLEHVTVELAEALTGSGNASRHLNFLARNHVFTFDTERSGAYRYHNLLRDFLRQRFVQEEGKAAFRALQRKTAVALEESGDRPSATELLLSANELELALDVIARGGEAELERRPSEQLRIWVRRLSPCIERQSPWALVSAAVLATRESRFSIALDHLHLASALLERSSDMRGLYQALSITEWAEFWSGDPAASMDTCHRALQYAETDTERLHTLLSLSSAALDMRRWNSFAEASARADELLPRAGSDETTRAQALRAHAAFYQGLVRDARDLIAHSYDEHQNRAQRASMLNTHGMVELALSEYANASACFQDAARIADEFGQVLASSMIEDNVALLEASLGRFAAAETRLDGLLARSEELDSAMLCFVLTHQGTVLRRKGDVRDALEPNRIAVETISETRDPYLALNARANLAFSEGLLGIDRGGVLIRTSELARQAGISFVEFKATLYAGILASIAGDELAAIRLLEECLPPQLSLGHINLIAQELGPRPGTALSVLRRYRTNALGPSLLHAMSRHWDFQSVAPVLQREGPPQVRTWAERVLAGFLPKETQAGTAHLNAGQCERPAQSLPGQLTSREQTVLSLMAANLSNEEIAQELFIAISTVKTHVNHILRKLEQKTRVGAILEYQRLSGQTKHLPQLTKGDLHP